MRKYRWAAVLTCVAAVLAMSAQAVLAIPAFARKEGLKCQSCHFRMPDLNPFGRAYAQRGFRVAVESGAKKKETKPAATAPAKGKKPLGTPTTKLPNYVDIEGRLVTSPGGSIDDTFTISRIGLLLGGALSGQWSAFVDPNFSAERNSDTNQAYVQYVTKMGPMVGSIRFGQMLPYAILLNQGRSGASIQPPDSLTLATQDGSPTTLLRGIEVGLSRQNDWYAYAGAARLHFNDELDDAPWPGHHTNFYASYEKILDSKGDSVALYGLSGRVTDPYSTYIYNYYDYLYDYKDADFHKIGLFANIYQGRTKGVLGYVNGKMDSSVVGPIRTSGWFLQAETLLSDRWAVFGRYDHFRGDWNDPEYGRDTFRFSDSTIGASYWLSTQTSLTLEDSFNEGDSLFLGRLLWVY